VPEVHSVAFISPSRQSPEEVSDYAVKKVVHTKELIVNGVAYTGGSGCTTGAGAPIAAPSKVGDFYIDTTSKILYVAMGTAAASDWKGVLTQ
jgi:hypothetical protein